MAALVAAAAAEVAAAAAELDPADVADRLVPLLLPRLVAAVHAELQRPRLVATPREHAAGVRRMGVGAVTLPMWEPEALRLRVCPRGEVPPGCPSCGNRLGSSSGRLVAGVV